MATCNFWTMKKFPLWAMGNDEVCEYYLGDEDENGNPYEEYSDDDIDLAWDIFNDELLYGEFGEDIKDLNENLKWYKVTIKNGYYSGVQFYVESEWSDINGGYTNPNGTFCPIWDDDECNYYFDLNLEDTKKMIAEEEYKIIEWLKNTINYGFRELICLGVFSNGEAIYQWKDTMVKGE